MLSINTETPKHEDGKTLELKDIEATQIIYSHASNELWVGDKKGLIHIYNAEDLEKVQTIEKKHT